MRTDEKNIPLRHFIFTKKKEKFFSLLSAVVPSRVSQKDRIKRNKKQNEIDRHLNYRDRTDQDYKDPQDGKILSSSKILPCVFPTWELFPLVCAPEQICVRAASVLQEKHRERENNKSKEKRIYRKENERRNNAKRETGIGEGLVPLYRLIRVGRRGWKWSKETCDLTVALFLLALFAVVAALFTFPVPRSPFFELHAPNPTSDPHKGRRGRDTFGKSSATPLQRIRRVSQKSLVPRYVCFSDSLGSGAQTERETDASRVWSIARDVSRGCVNRLEKGENHGNNRIYPTR